VNQKSHKKKPSIFNSGVETKIHDDKYKVSKWKSGDIR